MRATIVRRSDSVIRNLNPVVVGRGLWCHRNLIRQFTRRELEGRYRGSFLGILWSFVTPVILLLVYTFAFGMVLGARWPHARSDSLAQFAIILFCGLAAFNVFGECMNRAAGLIVAVPNYVKRVVFPLEILPVSLIGSAMFHGMVSVLVLLAANLVVNGTLPWTVILLPLVAVPLVFLSLGLTWFLASLGVFVRDVGYAVSLLVQILFFATPLFYPVEAIPPSVRSLVYLNPLTSIVSDFRAVLLGGSLPDWQRLAFWVLATGVSMLLGYAWFMRTKKAFADVL